MIDNGEFIDFLKRDKARRNLAPHQIILLISVFNLGRTCYKIYLRLRSEAIINCKPPFQFPLGTQKLQYVHP